MKDLIARLTSAKTTVMAVISALLTVMVALRIVSEDALTEGIAATGNVYEAILTILGSISTIALLLSKDSKVIEKELSE